VQPPLRDGALVGSEACSITRGRSFGDPLAVPPRPPALPAPVSRAPDKNRGFGFVEFAEEGDAQDALENMEGSELFGRTLRVAIARPMQKKNQPVWAEAEEWFKSLKEGEEQPGGDAETAGS
jgi:hypothetical protein